jgi:hypothetical protein
MKKKDDISQWNFNSSKMFWFVSSYFQCGKKSWDIPVGIATDYGLDSWMIRIQILAEAGNFSLQHHVQTGSEAHPVSYPVGTRGSFPGVKQPGHEADHSPPSSPEVEKSTDLYIHSPNTFSWCDA